MAIDIASPGANEAALKEAIGNLTGLVKVISHVVSAPVEYIDFDLPGTDAAFIFMFSNVRFSTSDQFCAAFSADGGATFHNDVANFDTYLSVEELVFGNGSGTVNATLHQYIDALAYFNLRASGADTNLPLAGESVITPGASNSYPSISTVSSLMPGGGLLSLYRSTAAASFYQAAIAAPVLARQNLIRVLPYGDGNAVPVSGTTITSGSFSLLRIPA